jgi:hypothetical protein
MTHRRSPSSCNRRNRTQLGTWTSPPGDPIARDTELTSSAASKTVRACATIPLARSKAASTPTAAPERHHATHGRWRIQRYPAQGHQAILAHDIEMASSWIPNLFDFLRYPLQGFGQLFFRKQRAQLREVRVLDPTPVVGFGYDGSPTVSLT